MESFGIILEILIGILILFVLWNNISNLSVVAQLKKSEQPQPLEKYYELKSKIQFLTFSALLLIGVAGLLGYDSYKRIEEKVAYKLENHINNQNAQIDSVNQQIYKKLNTQIDNNNFQTKALFSAIDSEISSYNHQIKEMNKTIGYKSLNVVDDFTVSNFKNRTLVIPFKNFGYDKFNSVPTVFINPNGDFDVKTMNVNEEAFDIRISNTNADSVSINILFFVN